MQVSDHPALVRALLAALAVFSLSVRADGTAAPQYRSGTLRVEVAAAEVSMQLRMPMSRADASAAKQELSVADVVARLKAADKLFVFPAGGKCAVESANAFAVDAQGKPTTGDGNIQAMYRFRCDGAAGARIESLAVKLFEQLPGLEKLQLQLTTDKGERNAELTPTASDVAL